LSGHYFGAEACSRFTGTAANFEANASFTYGKAVAKLENKRTVQIAAPIAL
jgi:hypothetical protein